MRGSGNVGIVRVLVFRSVPMGLAMFNTRRTPRKLFRKSALGAISGALCCLLSGCPVTWNLTIRNASNGAFVIATSHGKLAVPYRGSIRTNDSDIRVRDDRGAMALELSGAFGKSCHELMFTKFGQGFEVDAMRHEAHLVVAPTGSVHVERSGTRPSLSEEVQKLPRLDGCH